VLVAGFFFAPPGDGEWGADEAPGTIVVGTQFVRTLRDSVSLYFSAKTSSEP